MIQIGGDGPQGGGQGAQAPALGELTEGHGADLLSTGESAYAEVAPVTGKNARERLLGHELHHLGEQSLTTVHVQSIHRAS